MTVIGEQSTSAKSEIRTKCDLWVFSRTSLLSSGLFIQVGTTLFRDSWKRCGTPAEKMFMYPRTQADEGLFCRRRLRVTITHRYGCQLLGGDSCCLTASFGSGQLQLSGWPSFDTAVSSLNRSPQLEGQWSLSAKRSRVHWERRHRTSLQPCPGWIFQRLFRSQLRSVQLVTIESSCWSVERGVGCFWIRRVYGDFQ